MVAVQKSKRGVAVAQNAKGAAVPKSTGGGGAAAVAQKPARPVISPDALRRASHRGGCLSVSAAAIDVMREQVLDRLRIVLRNATTIRKYSGRKTVSTDDVKAALEICNRKIY